jgi:hypothetical protein
MVNHAYVHDLHDTTYLSPANTNTFASFAHSAQPQIYKYIYELALILT